MHNDVRFQVLGSVGASVNGAPLTVGASRPSFDKTKCIECCCCHEGCPQKAIALVQSPFLEFIHRVRRR